MARYVMQRLLAMLLTLFIIVTVAFLVIRLSYTINIQHLLSLVKLLNPRRIHRNVCL